MIRRRLRSALSATILGTCLLGVGILLTSAPGRAQFLGGNYDIAREQAEAARALLENAQGAPARVALSGEGTLRLEGGLQFVGRDIASRYLQTNNLENPADLVGLLLYGGRTEPWIAVIRLVRDGFIDAGAITRWTPDDLLASIKDDIARENQARAKKSLPPRIVEGWRIPPRHDPETNSLLWSVRSYVAGVSSMNESDATAHLAVFGRNGYFQIDVTAAGATIREYARDFPMLADNLRFVEGKGYGDFLLGTDTVARHGLATVFGVESLRHVGFLEGDLTGERLMIFGIGGGLVLGAATMAGALFAANRRRNRRI